MSDPFRTTRRPSTRDEIGRFVGLYLRARTGGQTISDGLVSDRLRGALRDVGHYPLADLEERLLLELFVEAFGAYPPEPPSVDAAVRGIARVARLRRVVV